MRDSDILLRKLTVGVIFKSSRRGSDRFSSESEGHATER